MSKEQIGNVFSRGMILDTPPSMQPDGSYRVAVNAQMDSYDYTSAGLFNSPSNELCFTIQEGFKICGWALIEERDEIIVFSFNEATKISQIGLGNLKTCEYKIVLEDKDDSRFLQKFCFSPSEKINPQFKHLRPCNNLWVYWSNNFTYYRLNLDADLCDIKYEDIVLFDCKCPSVINAYTIDDGSDLLDVGAYQFACQLIDDDENKTNWFPISNPVSLTGMDNAVGDKSDKAFLIEIKNLPKSFPKVALAVIKTVGGIQTAEVFSVLYHNGRKISYVYRGKNKDDEPIEIAEILSRKTGYIQGRDLIQRDGRLYLYNLKEEWNLDAQKYANKIKTSFNVWGLPAKFAGDYPTLPRGEVISLAAVYNYCDGTSSLGFHIPGRGGSKDDFTVIPAGDPKNCTACDLFKWQIEDTAFIEESYCTASILELSQNSANTVEGTFIDGETLYLPLTEEDERWHCKATEVTVDDDSGVEIGERCPPYDSGGVEDCEECLDVESQIEVVIGKTFCPDDEECVDGRCPSTGNPCLFCNTCGNDKYKKVVYASQYEYTTSESDIASIDFSACPAGEPLYDDEGCRIIGYKPSKVAKGKFGYWESEETYPKTKDCNGDYLYQELAGRPIRHHMVPDEGLIQFHHSKRMGVVCNERPDNHEWEDTNVFIIGLEVCNIELPPNPPKPYCPNNPVSIYWQKVDPTDRRVTARGLFTHTYKGNIGNKEYAVPKHAVNSLELIDRHIDRRYDSIDHNRFGDVHHLPIYTFHSPDTTFQKAPLLADRVKIPFEIFGTGKRYGTFGEGEEPLNMWHTTMNVRGARQAINLNQYEDTGESVIITKPAQCQRRVTFTYTINGCEAIPGEPQRKDVFAAVSVDVQGSLIEFFSANIGGYSLLRNGSSSSISIQLPKPSGRGVPFSVAFKDIVLVLRDPNNPGVTCRYTPADVEGPIVIGKPLSCKWEYVLTGIRSENETSVEVKFTGGFSRCIKGLSYAPHDSIVSKGDLFTYPLLNLKREDSVYVELEGDRFILNKRIDPFLNDSLYNGGASIMNQTSDGSFFGDWFCQECPIHLAAGHFGMLLNDSPNQYGRIESATYIPLGMDLSADEVICGKAERYGIGDSWIGMYSFRRFGYVTDKVGTINQQNEPDTYGKMDIEIDSIRLKHLLCLGDCSKMPTSCEEDENVDNRKSINLREFSVNGKRGCWDGTTRFAGNPTNPIRDTYLPNTLNTLVHFWTESRINLNKRKSGISDPYTYELNKNYPTSKGAEIYYRKLKTIDLDPEFPKGTAWTRAWLSRVGIQWQTIAVLKRFARTILKILLTVGIAIALASLGIIGIVAFFIILFNDSLNSSLCKLLSKLLGIRQCFPRCYNGESNCHADHSQLLPFERNYSGYNWDFNTQNDLETKIGMTDPYDTCICDVGEGNQMVYSQKQNPLSIIDSYKNFLPNSYIHLPASSGKIKNLFNWGNNFYAHTSDMIINIATSDGILDLGNGQALEVITQGGELRTMPKELISDVPEGFAGTRDPNAAINTPLGRVFVDRESKSIFVFNSGLEEISLYGIKNFLKENLDIELVKQFPNFTPIDEAIGVGYKIGYDHRFNKLVITKIDYIAKFPEKLELVDNVTFRHKESKQYVSLEDETHFFNNSFTLSYDPKNKRWISFETFYPDGYVWDRDHLYSIKDGGFWKHGDSYGDFQKYYGHYYPHSVEFVIKHNDGGYAQFVDMEIDTEVESFDGENWVKGVDKTFDKALFYNDNQISGEVLLNKKDKVNTLSNITQTYGEVTYSKVNDIIRINGIVDRSVDKDIPIFDGRGKDGLNIVNQENIGNSKTPLEGKYMIARLILDDPNASNVQHLTKRVITTQNKRIQ